LTTCRGKQARVVPGPAAVLVQVQVVVQVMHGLRESLLLAAVTTGHSACQWPNSPVGQLRCLLHACDRTQACVPRQARLGCASVPPSTCKAASTPWPLALLLPHHSAAPTLTTTSPQASSRQLAPTATWSSQPEAWSKVQGSRCTQVRDLTAG
jgi:hypothetical protein